MPPESSVMTVSVRSPSCVTVMPYNVQATARSCIVHSESEGVTTVMICRSER